MENVGVGGGDGSDGHEDGVLDFSWGAYDAYEGAGDFVFLWGGCEVVVEDCDGLDDRGVAAAEEGEDGVEEDAVVGVELLAGCAGEGCEVVVVVLLVVCGLGLLLLRVDELGAAVAGEHGEEGDLAPLVDVGEDLAEFAEVGVDEVVVVGQTSSKAATADPRTIGSGPLAACRCTPPEHPSVQDPS